MAQVGIAVGSSHLGTNYVALMQRGMVMWSVVASSGIVLPSFGHEKILLGSMGAAHWE